MGEFIWDFAWAHGAQNAGIRYFPKLVAAVPFTPAGGRRLLVHPSADRNVVAAALGTGLRMIADKTGASSIHVLFCREDELALLAPAGFVPRASYQFQWAEPPARSLPELRRLLERVPLAQPQAGPPRASGGEQPWLAHRHRARHRSRRPRLGRPRWILPLDRRSRRQRCLLDAGVFCGNPPHARASLLGVVAYPATAVAATTSFIAAERLTAATGAAPNRFPCCTSSCVSTVSSNTPSRTASTASKAAPAASKS